MQASNLSYNADGLIPCIVQDADTREVLMMAWMNEESVRRTLDEGTTWFLVAKPSKVLAQGGRVRKHPRTRRASL